MTLATPLSLEPPVHQRNATCLSTNARTILLYVVNREGSSHGH